jgi:enediyne biosynthesis protein E4
MDRFAPSRTAFVVVAAVGAMVLVVAVGAVGVFRITGQGATAGAAGPPSFLDETAGSRLDHRYDGADFFVGGGVAVFDCNGDLVPDVYLAGGNQPAALFQNDTARRSAFVFRRLTDPVTDLVDVTGAYPIDIDGDRQIDLAVLRRGENVLLRALGECRFERANERWGFDGGDAWSTAFSAKWEAASVLPTLAVGNYVEPGETGTTAGGTCADNELFRVDATSSVYAPAIPLSPGWCTLSILFSDWDRSGRRDLRITNDRHYYRDGEEQLWRIATGEAPRLYTAEEGWVRMQIWGMGIASHDLTGDGYPEVFLTSQADNKLQTLATGATEPRYRDIALRLGANAPRPFTGGDVLPSTAWHPEFADVNNDGLMDMFVSKGNVNVMADFAQKDPSNLLLGQADGTFRETAEEAGILGFARGRGAALADLNLDGLLDLIEVNYGDPVKVWRNVGIDAASDDMGHWLQVQLAQPDPNQAAIGSWVEVRSGGVTTRRELTIGGGHVGGQLGWMHFGLGDALVAEMRVQWPDGEVGPWLTLETNQFVTIERGVAVPRIIQPPTD